jgi:hypothetical protein
MDEPDVISYLQLHLEHVSMRGHGYKLTWDTIQLYT